MKEENNKIKQIFSLRHYYGDTVRTLFILAAIIIFLIVPFGGSSDPQMTVMLIATSIILTLFAGLTSPKTYTVALIDSLISGIGCFIFEILAVGAYQSTTMTETAFFVFQALAIIFLLALYFSIKTARGMNQTDERPEEPKDTVPREW